ncbi:MAG: DUF4395 domain-containing protein [Aliarcobacter sp.]|jgi:hypothetical protein|nr:DUF4395 domain-containing protein [Aliarcobacter sp.]
MSKSCPISLKQIDETIIRINAFIITILVLCFLISSNKFILYFIFIDFIIRVSKYNRFSLVLNFSKVIKKVFNLKTKMTDSGPKRWAMFFGLFFIFIIIILYSLDFKIALYLSIVFLLICSSLEAFFSFCLGCEIYYIYKKIRLNNEK